MGFRIACKEDIHLSALRKCPTDVQRDFRDALAVLKQSSRRELKRGDFAFLSRIDGHNQYQIEASDGAEKYVIIFEFIQNPLGTEDVIRILTIGRHDDIRS